MSNPIQIFRKEIGSFNDRANKGTVESETKAFLQREHFWVQGAQTTNRVIQLSRMTKHYNLSLIFI